METTIASTIGGGEENSSIESPSTKSESVRFEDDSSQ